MTATRTYPFFMRMAAACVSCVRGDGLGISRHGDHQRTTSSRCDVTATQADKKVVTTTDERGQFAFAELADGTWTLRLLCSKEFKQFTSSDRERQLQEALMLGDPVTDLSVALEVNYFRLARDRYFVPVSVKIPGSDIELARKGGAESTRLDFIGEVKDSKGVLQGTVRDDIAVKLKGETAGQLATRNLEYDTGFTLQPGAYTLKFLARENATGKMGTFETKFVIPDLTSEQKYLPLSSVVLSYQRESLAATVGSAERDKKLLAANPLIQDNQKLIPSVTRVFRKDHDMYVYLETYQPAAEKTELMVASVSFYRGKVKAFETAPLKITAGLNAKSKAVPVGFSVPLGKLQPGRYTCQVNVLNPSEQKFAVWRSPIVLLP